MKRTGALLVAAALALAAYNVDVRITEQKVSIDVAAEANAFVRRIGGALRRVGSAIRRGVSRVGRAVGGVVRRVGGAISGAVKKVGGAIKSAFKSIGDFAKKIKDKLIAKLKGFASKIYQKVDGYIQGIISKLVQTVSDKIGFNLMELTKYVDKSGRINENAIKATLLKKINDVVIPFVVDKARGLVDKGIALIKPLLDGAASAVIGALGTIPFAGGAIAAAVSAAYRMGMDALLKLATDGLAKKIGDLIRSLFSKGWNWVVAKVAPVKAVLDKILVSAKKLADWYKKAGKYLQ